MARCPGCKTMLTRVQEAGINMQSCGGCFGTWIARVALIRLTRLPMPEDLKKQPLEELAALVGESASKETRRCPECAVNMVKERFHIMIPLELDQCPKCKAFWLDAGKLSLLRRLYVEMHESTDPRIVQIREKLAQANLEWEMRREQLTDAAEQAKRMRQTSTGLSLAGVIRMLRP